jgi:NADH dehydrogenase (ubiquinone) 1 alpha/beta subcomplex 1, acyl-carrier protein
MASFVRTCTRLGSPAVRSALGNAIQLRFLSAAAKYLDRNEVSERVINIVKKFDQVDASKVSPAAHFTNDLGLDSLDAVEVVMAIEEEFAVEIPDAEAEKILSVEDAINYIASHPQAK